jgi:acyl-CoA synthetase (AMP-forming)/AMP-acid ligase II
MHATSSNTHENARHAGELRFATIGEMLETLAETATDRVAYRFLSDADPRRERALTYRQLYLQACSVGAGLRQRGLGRASKVVVVLPTSPEFLEVFYGAQLAGCVPVAAYPPYGLGKLDQYLERLATICRASDAELLCTTRSIAAIASQLLSTAPRLRAVITPAQLRAAGGDFRPATLAPEDTALLQFTSGTTGRPKGVELTHRNLLANVHAIGAGIRIDPDEDVGCMWLPLCHDMGLIGNVLGTAYSRIPLVLLSPQAFIGDPKRWLWAIHRYRVTMSAAPNFAYELCARRIDEEAVRGLDLSSWRAALNGAEPVSLSSLDAFASRFERHGFSRRAFFPVYGLAEATLAVTFPESAGSWIVDEVNREALLAEGIAMPSRDEAAPRLRMVSVGRPLRGIEIRIADGQGHDLPERHLGEVLVRGPSVMKGYYADPAATAAAFNNGWLRTGDLGYLADGHLFIAGRSKDIIIKHGRNYHPHELERAAETVRGVRAGCVVAFSVAREGEGTESVVVVFESRVSDGPQQQQLVQAVERAIIAAAGLRPDRVRVLPPHTLPKTTSGKLQRQLTRQMYLKGELTPARQRGMGFALAAILRSGLARVRSRR